MKDLLSHILIGITGKDTSIEETDDSNGFTIFKVTLPKEDIGLVIGRSGKTINAIKNILKIMAIKEDRRIDVEIAEENAN